MSDTRSSFHAPVPRADDGDSPDTDQDAPTSQMDRVPAWPDPPDQTERPGARPPAPKMPMPPVPPIPHVDAPKDDGWSFWERPKRSPEAPEPRASGPTPPPGAPRAAAPHSSGQPSGDPYASRPSTPLPRRKPSGTGRADAPPAGSGGGWPSAGPYGDAASHGRGGHGDALGAARSGASRHSGGPYGDVPPYTDPGADDALGAAPTSTFPAIDADPGVPHPVGPGFGGGFGSPRPTSPEPRSGPDRHPYPAPYAPDPAASYAPLDAEALYAPEPATLYATRESVRREDPAHEPARTDGQAHPATPPAPQPPATDAAPATPPAAPPAKRRRDPYLDNVKFLLIALVIMGHSLVPTLDADSARSAYLFIYVFHMPLFVIISGYLSRTFWNSNAKTNKLVDTFLVPYVIVEVLFAVLRYALGQKWSLTIIDPAWLNWYLVALLLWRLSTPVWKRMRFPITLSIIVYLLAGLSDLPGDFSMDRFFGLMPFFVIGLMLREEHLEMLNRTWIKVAAGFVLAGAVVVAILVAPHVKLGPIYYKSGYAELHMTWWTGMGVRVGLLIAALLMSAAILALVPRGRTWFSDLGTRTLYAYILHGVVVLTAKELGWLSFPWLFGPLGVAAIATSAFALAIILCLPETRRLFSWMLEPRLSWLYRTSSARSK
ncbi:acyltransferase family protein [Thermopolyspora sp. NPDC052614]|uniref:acyltransferase family protein n=1 Tax=Thermopolyspora sp. NPDC052614 TaxID=3155682 RepID=UPI003447966B